MDESDLLLDTSILINYLRNHKPTINFIDKALSRDNLSVAISAITEFELYSGKSLEKPQEKLKVDKLLDQFIIFPLTSHVLRLAGELKRQHSNISAGDAIIAATTIDSGFKLISPDEDFSEFLGLDQMIQPPK